MFNPPFTTLRIEYVNPSQTSKVTQTLVRIEYENRELEFMGLVEDGCLGDLPLGGLRPDLGSVSPPNKRHFQSREREREGAGL